MSNLISYPCAANPGILRTGPEFYYSLITLYYMMVVFPGNVSNLNH